MGRYVKSSSDTRELTKSIKGLEKEFSDQKDVIKKNTKELEKVNAQVVINKQKEMKLLQKRIHKLEMETQWVESSEPVLDIEPAHMLKKLDIL